MMLRGWLYAALLVGVARGQQVTGRSPYWMGDAGGVTLTVYGSGFSEDQFNQFDPTLGNKVYLVNEYETINCEVNMYLTNTEKIVCKTGPRLNTKGSGIFVITVFVDGVEAGGQSQTVEYADWVAPKIDGVEPLWALPNTQVTFNGWMGTNQYTEIDPSDPTSSATSGNILTKVYMGGVECSFVSIADNERNLVCDPKTKNIGPMNGTTYVTNRGSSVTRKSGTYVNTQDKLFQHHTYAVLSGVSPSSGSTKGDTLITVTGTYFDPYPGKTQVWVGGRPCKVQDVQDETLTCLTPPEAATPGGSAGSGLKWELWDTVYVSDLLDDAAWAALTTSHAGYSSSHLLQASVDVNVTSQVSGKMSGIFHPPHDGRYAFGTNGIDSKFFISNTTNPDFKVYVGHWTIVDLMKDTPVYLELRYRSQDVGSGMVEMKMNDFDGKYTASQSVMGSDEKHRFSVNPDVTFEKQRISLSGSVASAKIYLNGYLSEAVNISSADEVRSAIMGLTDQQCMVAADNPKYLYQTSYEMTEEAPNGEKFGASGWFSADVAPYCGKYSLRINDANPQLFWQDDESLMPNAKMHQYLCFAAMGSIKDMTSRIQYRWWDNSGRSRTDNIYFNLTIAGLPTSPSAASWTYTCWDLMQVMQNSWINNNIDNTKPVLIRGAWVGNPSTDRDIIYVDELSFVSEQITVTQSRPSALKTLGILGKDVVVTEVAGENAVDVEFPTGNCVGGFSLLGVTSDSAPANWLTTLQSMQSQVFTVSGESVTVTRTAAATNQVTGTWSMTFASGETVDNIPFEIEASVLDTMIESVLGSTGMTVSRSGNCEQYLYHVEWNDSPGRKEISTMDVSNLVFDGSQIRSNVDRTREGKVWHHPIQGAFFSVYEDTPHVVVEVSGYRAVCQADCSFTYSDATAITITSVAGTASGSSHVLTIMGSGFTSTDTSDYTATVGDADCVVSAVTSSQVTCTVAALTAGSYPVKVAMQPVGASNSLQYTAVLSINSVSPSTGGQGGLYTVVISGMGFPADLAGWDGNTITFDGLDCTPVASAVDAVSCIVPPHASGSVNVVADVDGDSFTLQNGFTYDSSVAAVITSATYASASVLGGDVLTVSGSSFGSGTGGSVTVGGKACDVTAWADTSITCSLPPNAPGPHQVLVDTGSNGYAVPPSAGGPVVTYTLKVTSTSSMIGSVNGGTKVVIRGQGFGSDCSLLAVDIGEFGMCEVESCSDIELMCVVKRVPKEHVVENIGVDKVFGFGYAWEPKRVVVAEGDTVTWKWAKSSAVSQAVFDVFQTADASSLDYDGKGFNSGSPRDSGMFSVEFSNQGMYYYGGSRFTNGLVMTGQVVVLDPATLETPVAVYLGEFMATYETDGTSASVTSSCSPIVDTAITGCTESTPSLAGLSFLWDSCYTPTVTSVTASATENIPGLGGLQVRSGVQLTIGGSGFGSVSCQNEVMVGGASCTVTSASDTQLVCTLADVDNLVSLKPSPLYVNVINRGVANLDVANFDTEGQLSVVPVIDALTPTQGSISGGTELSITGSGLNAFDGLVSVLVGASACQVTLVSSGLIKCLTPQGTDGTKTVSVRISAFSVAPIINGANMDFTYSSAITPSISSVTPSGVQLVISGANFGSDASAVTVTITATGSRHKRDVETLKPKKTLARYLVAKFDEHDAEERYSLLPEEYLEQFVTDNKLPIIRADTFDSIIPKSGFWGDFTKTGAANFAETLRLGAWKRAGSNRKALPEVSEEVVEVREKRQVRSDSYDCTPTAVSSSSITCTPVNLPAGLFEVSVTVDGVGSADVTGSANFNSASAIGGISPVTGSLNGGTLLTISGTGFVVGDISVTVGGLSCDLVTASASEITCLTPSNAAGSYPVVVTTGGSPTSAPTQFQYSASVTPVLNSVSSPIACCGARITISASGAAGTSVYVNDELCDGYGVGGATDCLAPELAAGTYDVVLKHPVNGNSNAMSVTYDFAISGISPATGGFGGAEITISGTGFDPNGGSTVTVCGNACPVVSGGFGSITCIAPPMDQATAAGSTTVPCTVVVTNPTRSAGSVRSTNIFTYDSSITPYVSAITPVRGGTAGGTVITITGSGFAASGNTVSIGGSSCTVQAESTSSITCETNEHEGPGKFPVEVTVPAKGIATSSDEFFYIDRWSSVFTWGGEPVPGAGQLVVIENDQTILLDESTEVLEMLLIKGGHLVFDDESSQELILRAKYILVVEGGSLSIGSEEMAFEGDAVIELYGNTRSIELPHYGAKVMAIRNGTLDLHGKHIPITWTHLAATANPGDTTITLKLPVTWKAGDQIVIATTEHRFSLNENEVRTIASVSADGLTVTLTEALDHEHVSIVQTFGSHTIETRAEVGLLTRNIKIRGAINQDFTETIEACDELWTPGQFDTQSCFNGRFGEEIGSDQFGATVMLFGKSPDYDLVKGRIEYVEVTEAGQAFQLGRYPLHFHLVGNVNASYIRGCAVHRTYNRAVTIHAADYLLVERNVVYNNMGHAIFTEDGVEQNNIIQYNLAVYTRTSSSLLNVDITPSSYWVVHPNNIVRHNAAAGGTHFGYWYRLERHPSGPSATTSICQNNAPMGQFVNNTAHSIGRYGLWVFSMDGYFPKSGNCRGSDIVGRWDGFTVWRVDRGAEIVIGGNLQFHNFIALDNEHAGLEMVEMHGVFGDNGPGIWDSVVIGHSDLTPGGCADITSGIIAPKKYVMNIRNVEFYNYDTNKCTALTGCSQCKVFQGGYKTQVSGLTFVNSPNKMKFLWEHETVWIDSDGSLTGTAESRVVRSMGILPPSCVQNAAFSIDPLNPGSVCPPGTEFNRISIKGKNVRPSSFQGGDLIISNAHGNTSVPYRIKRLDGNEGWMADVIVGDTYDFLFEDGQAMTDIKYEMKSKMMTSGQYYFVRHQFMQRIDYLSTNWSPMNSSEAMPDPATAGNGDFYYDNSTMTMTYIVSRSSGRRKRELFDTIDYGVQKTIKFETYACEFVGCVPPTPAPIPTGRPDVTFRWSDTESWKEVPVGTGGHPTDGTYGLPVEGDSITIPAGMWLIVDTATPPLGRVYVYGAIEFEDTMDHVFNASIIYIQSGSVIAGFSESEPFTHNLDIVLRGDLDPNNPDNVNFPMPGDTPDVGWKSIGVFGQLSLHGSCPTTSWVKLGATAAAGDTTVTLSAAADPTWVNKQVVITTTGKEATESEIRTVTAVSGSTLTLDAALQYQHLGETHSLSNGATYTMAGEVGLLTHNIAIQGSEYANLAADGFGGRVLVSTYKYEEYTYAGFAKLSCVEFRNMGQLGWTDSYDPRFSLAFHTIDNTTEPSYVKKCSFNKNYNAAIGVFNSADILVEDNVVYHVVGAGVVDEGTDNMYNRNLVTTQLCPCTFNGEAETQALHYEGAFHIINTQGVYMDGNVVAGSEMSGYRTYGEPCEDATRWLNNEVHGVNYGVMSWKKSGFGPRTDCRRFSNFYAWRIVDTAFYAQHYANQLVDNAMVVDSLIGVNQLIIGPPPLAHLFEPQTATIQNSIFVGASPSHTCDYQNSQSIIAPFLRKNLSPGTSKGGNSAIFIASFMSGINMAPKSVFYPPESYPAIMGSTHIDGVTFANYGSRACGEDIAITGNPLGDDAVHPVFTNALTFLDTAEDFYLFYPVPRLAPVDPSDCVDMTCDGHKKIVLTDEDGSLLGTAGASATAEADYEWDGDRSHGVGDYRIPTALKMNPDGTQIPEADKFPNKGIVHDSSCTHMTSWRAWKCTAITHRMMIIESMDADTEIRRLSPIALIANPGSNGYVDLLNGPMDRGWCMGYTCQERISTFYSVVGAGVTYEMAMTSTPPQHIRFHLLNSQPGEKVLLRIFFPKTQRYDVYVDDVFVPPTNIDTTKYPGTYDLLPTNSAFEPTIASDVGSNYLAREDKFLHVVLEGGHIVDIKTTPTIVMSLGVTVDPDNFFEENIVQNLALMLGIAPENIRVTNVVRETSRKRSVGEKYNIEAEIASAPTATVDGTDSGVAGSNGEVLDYTNLQATMANAINNYQSNSCGNCNYTSIDHLTINEPVPPPEAPEGHATESFGAPVFGNGTTYSQTQQDQDIAELEESLKDTVYDQPSDSELLQETPALVKMLTPFDLQPVLAVKSSNGSVMRHLGHASDPWMVTAFLSGGPEGAFLVGNTTVPYVDGGANFTNLAVSTPGQAYNISFRVTKPDTAPQLSTTLTNLFSAERKEVKLLLSAPKYVTAKKDFSISLTLEDLDSRSQYDGDMLTGQLLSGIAKSLKRKIKLLGNTSVTESDEHVAAFEMGGLQVSRPFNKFRFKLDSDIEPAGWTLRVVSRKIMVLPEDVEIPEDPLVVDVKVRGKGARGPFFKKNAKEYQTKAYNEIRDKIKTGAWINPKARNDAFSLQLVGSEAQVKESVQILCQKMKSKSMSFKLKGVNVYLASLKVNRKRVRC